MIPLVTSYFWGVMAIIIAGDLLGKGLDPIHKASLADIALVSEPIPGGLNHNYRKPLDLKADILLYSDSILGFECRWYRSLLLKVTGNLPPMKI